MNLFVLIYVRIGLTPKTPFATMSPVKEIKHVQKRFHQLETILGGGGEDVV
jgi:hypothetical protein